MERRSLVLIGAAFSAILFFMSGCASGANVYVSSSVPKPLIDSLPATVGIHFSDDLKEFVFEEKIANHGIFRIELGESQEQLFERIFGAMFNEVTKVDSPDATPSGVDAIIVPRINEVQIAIPQQTRGDFYEVWISYSIKLNKLDGTTIHDWRIAAYGKANSKNYKNPLDRPNVALADATDNAIRDAAAIISFYFAQERPVRNWISGLRTT